jgi:mitosis inhibitor protein kinase SWE1
VVVSHAIIGLTKLLFYRGEPWHRLRQEDFEQVDMEGSVELFKLIRSMMRTNPEDRVDIVGVYEHVVVVRAREAMVRAWIEARGRGGSVFVGTPLASVGSGFLEFLLGG